MPVSLEHYLTIVWASVRVADAVDVFVVSVIVYGGIVWFQQSRSRLVMSGLATVVALYFAAGLLDMHLTLALFQAGITVAAVALVIIFQDEIRRGFERVALASRLRAFNAEVAADADVDKVVEAVATMAKSKTGALLVFRGREPLARNLTGGVPLNGRLSEPLIYSIFDPSSPGHDGALIIQDGLVTHFAAHLPLSVEIDGHERFGTRHTAALGLSERCDALVVVVSEERGVVSVAENGSLTELGTSAALRKRISAFKARVSPARNAGRMRELLTRNFSIKMLSVAIALAAWLVAFGYRAETAIRTMSAPVVFKDIPSGWVVTEPSPLEVLVSLSGPQRALERLEANELSVAIDASRLKTGLQRSAISSSEVDAPSGVVVRGLNPTSVRFKAERTVEASVTVEVKTSGRISKGYLLKKISVEPPQVKLVVPDSRRSSIRRISTEAIALDGLTRSASMNVPLDLPSGAALGEGERDSVTVRVEVSAQ